VRGGLGRRGEGKDWTEERGGREGQEGQEGI